MRVIPVLDLLGGQVVRGTAGRRHEYRPVQSQLTRSSEPVEVARAIHRAFGLSTFYVADLDAIAGQLPASETFAALRREGFQLWIDAGIRQAGDADRLADAGVDVIVAGLETIARPETLLELCGALSPSRVAFSLDLRDGRPIGDSNAWQSRDPWHIALRAIDARVQRVIVLDLARVGMGGGTGTEDLCRRLKTTFPHVEVIAAGGIRGIEDLQRLSRAGIDAALVASALHNARLTRNDIDDVQ